MHRLRRRGRGCNEALSSSTMKVASDSSDVVSQDFSLATHATEREATAEFLEYQQHVPRDPSVKARMSQAGGRMMLKDAQAPSGS